MEFDLLGMLILSTGEDARVYYQRFNVNMIGLTRHFVREMNTFLSGPTIPRTGIGK